MQNFKLPTSIFLTDKLTSSFLDYTTYVQLKPCIDLRLRRVNENINKSSLSASIVLTLGNSLSLCQRWF